MMNKLHYLLGVIVTAILIAGCSKQIEQKEDLAGAWEWKSTNGGFGFHLHETPATTGKKETLKLTKEGRYFKYTNDVVTEEGLYSLTEESCIHDQKLKTIIEFSRSAKTYMVEKMDRAQLVLSDEHYDGVEIIYERKNGKDN